MKTKTFILLIGSTLLTLMSFSQITKGNWMTGGNFSFKSTKSSDGQGYYFKTNTLAISPNIGYFFIDKLAVGIRPSFSTQKIKYNPTGVINNYTSKRNEYGIGPYVRYYILQPTNRINFFAETSFLHSIVKDMYTIQNSETTSANTYSFAAGPVIYFNSSVGLELMVGYTNKQYVNSIFSDKTFFANIGFQIHLEKEQ